MSKDQQSSAVVQKQGASLQKNYSQSYPQAGMGDEGAFITPRQSASLIASSIIGVSVLALPRLTAQYALEAGWLATIAGALVGIIATFFLTRLGLRFPYMSIVEYSKVILGSEKKLVGRVIGKILTFPIVVAFFAYWLISSAIVSRSFGEVVVGSVLTNTPIEVIIGTMLVFAFIFCMYEIEVVARVNEILIPLIVIPVLLIAIFSFQAFEFKNILPIWPDLSIASFLRAALITAFAYQGYEVISIFSAYTHVTQKNTRLNILGILVPLFVYLLIVVAGISVFGVDELEYLMWPTLELVKVTQFPGLILERMESAFLGVWVAAVFTGVGNLFYISTVILSRYFKVGQHRRWFALGLTPVIFWLSLLPQNILELFEWQTHIGYFGFSISFGIPFLLFGIAKLRKKGDDPIQYEEERRNNQSKDQQNMSNATGDSNQQNGEQQNQQGSTEQGSNSNKKQGSQKRSSKKQGE